MVLKSCNFAINNVGEPQRTERPRRQDNTIPTGSKGKSGNEVRSPLNILQHEFTFSCQVIQMFNKTETLVEMWHYEPLSGQISRENSHHIR